MNANSSKFVALCNANSGSKQTAPTLPETSDGPETLPLCSPAEHVVKRRDYLIPTPPIKIAFNIAYKYIGARQRGVAFMGPPRIGKTCAMDYLVTTLRPLFPDRTFFIFDAWEHDKPSRSAHYVDLLIGLGAKAATSGKRDAWRERLATQLWVLTAESHNQDAVFLIDEAQNLHAEELGGLKNLCVALEKKNIRVVTLLWGQVELQYQRSLLAAEQREDIKSRFMSPVFEFHGLRSAGELREVLDAYDIDSEYPAGSSITFTQYFFPRAYATGWRLASEASRLWHAIETITGENAKEIEVGMDGISATIEHFLRDHSEEDHERWRPDPKYWEEAVEFSGLAALPATARTPKTSSRKKNDV